jgi:hypothetical protein
LRPVVNPAPRLLFVRLLGLLYPLGLFRLGAYLPSRPSVPRRPRKGMLPEPPRCPLHGPYAAASRTPLPPVPSTFGAIDSSLVFPSLENGRCWRPATRTTHSRRSATPYSPSKTPQLAESAPMWRPPPARRTCSASIRPSFGRTGTTAPGFATSALRMRRPNVIASFHELVTPGHRGRIAMPRHGVRQETNRRSATSHPDRASRLSASRCTPSTVVRPLACLGPAGRRLPGRRSLHHAHAHGPALSPDEGQANRRRA